MTINKKIILKQGKEKNDYYIEKIRKMKDLGRYKVDVVVSGVTRQIRIYKKSEKIGDEEEKVYTEFSTVICAKFQSVGISIIDNKPK